MSALTVNIKAMLDYIRGKGPVPEDSHIITATDAVKTDGINEYLRDLLAQANEALIRLNGDLDQMKFLLASAPMIDMFDSKSSDSRTRLSKVVSPFAYVHPKTLAPFTWGMPPKHVYVFPGSKTVWVPISAMPEGRVIFSPLPIPGIEKLLVG